jgi:putative membrane protein
MTRTSIASLAALTSIAAICMFATTSARGAEKFNKNDSALVDSVASNLRMGMESGKLARDRANHKIVKEYAAKVVQDDQKLWDELRDLSKRHNYDVEGELAKGDTQMKQKLKDLEGQQFDLRFVKMSMHEHQQLISAFRKGADSADADDLKKFFDQNERLVRENLDRAKELNEKLEKGD